MPDHSPPLMAHPQPTLPPEVLYDVVALLFSEHLGALIADDHKLKYAAPSTSEEPAGSGDSVLDCTLPPRTQNELSAITSLLLATY